jgi:hypothetical protein
MEGVLRNARFVEVSRVKGNEGGRLAAFSFGDGIRLFDRFTVAQDDTLFWVGGKRRGSHGGCLCFDAGLKLLCGGGLAFVEAGFAASLGFEDLLALA